MKKLLTLLCLLSLPAQAAVNQTTTSTTGNPDVETVQSSYGAGGDGPAVQFRENNGTSYWTPARIIGHESVGYAGDLAFETRSNVGSPGDTTTEHMRLRADGSFLYNTASPIMTQQGTGTGLPFTNPAKFSMNGLIAASGGSGEHLFMNSWSQQNVAAFQDTAQLGNSAITFLDWQYGHEQGAIGYGNSQGYPWGSEMFIESSNYDGTNANVPNPFVISLTGILTGETLDAPHIRLRLLSNGDVTLGGPDITPTQEGSLYIERGGNLHINGVHAVSCSGAPSASFAVTNGIVTHC